MLDSRLTTYIPQAVNNILYFLHYFTSKRLWSFLSPQFEKKKVTKTPERSGLEPKTIRSRIFGLSTWAICELTIAGGKSLSNHFGPDGQGQPVPAFQRSLHRDTTLSSRTFRVEGQVSGERVNLPGIRLLFPSASKIPAWLFPSPYWPRLRLGQYVGSENNRRYFLGLEK